MKKLAASQILMAVIPQSAAVRRALGVSIGLVVAVLMDNYFSSLHQFWIPLIATILLLAYPQPSLKYLLGGFIGVGTSLSIAWLLIHLGIPVFVINSILFVLLVVGCLCEAALHHAVVIYLIPAMLYLFWHRYWPAAPLYDLLHDASVAALISGLVTMFVYPTRAAVDFRRGLIPVFAAYKDYLHSIMQFLFDRKVYEYISYEKKLQVMYTLQADRGLFPEWVYDFGFNVFFRQGHRHFLVRTEQVGAVLFAMHQIARYDIENTFLDNFKPAIQAAANATEAMFGAIIDRLKLTAVELPIEQLQETLTSLDEALAKMAPPTIELIDISEDSLRSVAFIYELKALQKLLLKLTEALR